MYGQISYTMDSELVGYMLEWVRLFVEADARVYWAEMGRASAWAARDARCRMLSQLCHYRLAYEHCVIRQFVHFQQFILFYAMSECDYHGDRKNKRRIQRPSRKTYGELRLLE